MHDKWLLAESVICVIFLLAKTRCRKHNHMDSLRTVRRNLFSLKIVSALSMRFQTVLAKVKYDGQSQQEARIGRPVYTLRAIVD